MGYIYLRKNKINGKKYVGQTVDIKERNYKWNCLNDRYGGYAINNARKRYGADGFSFEILKECPNEDMNYWEMYYIKMYNSKNPYGYNMTDGGDSTYEKSDETKKKIADALRGKKRPNISAALRGKKQSPETIEKRAVKLRGRKLSEEAKAKVGAAQSKVVQALDKNGNVVMEFPSAAEAGRQGYGDQRHISACCRGERKSHKGYIWRYKENAQEQ